MPENEKNDDEPLGSLWEMLGLPEPIYKPDSEAPPIDYQLLRMRHRNELTEEDAKKVDSLTSQYKCWLNAMADISVEEFRAINSNRN
jgi:hypothetical protein